MPDAPPVRVVMLVESSVVPAWLAALVARLAAADSVDLDVFTIGQQRIRRPRPYLLRLYESVDRRVFRCQPEALDPVRIEARPTLERRFDGCDVVLDFASPDPGVLARGVRYGAWVLTHGPTGGRREAALYETRIHAHFEGGGRFALYTSYGAIDPASPHRTRNQALWKAKGAFAHRLETVRRLGRGYVESCPRNTPPAGGDAAARPPSNRVVAGRAARAGFGVVRRRVRRLSAHEAWFIAARPRHMAPLTGLDTESTEGFAPIEWSSQTAVADPFLFEDDGDTYVFFEEEDRATRRAHISYLRLDAKARPASSVAIALEPPYHLSYPFVFRHEGEIFMIPESSANRTVELYRASPFPAAWMLEGVLLQGIHAVDATLHVDGERLWLFVGVAEEGAAPNDELHLYSSTSLWGPWEPHPANPVVSDVRSARPAGRVFRHDGRLIRPSQDCSRRYGYALVFNRIDVLTDDEYGETPLGRIEPNWFPGLVATHTYNFGNDVEVIDGKRAVPKPPFERFLR